MTDEILVSSRQQRLAVKNLLPTGFDDGFVKLGRFDGMDMEKQCKKISCPDFVRRIRFGKAFRHGQSFSRLHSRQLAARRFFD